MQQFPDRVQLSFKLEQNAWFWDTALITENSDRDNIVTLFEIRPKVFANFISVAITSLHWRSQMKKLILILALPPCLPGIALAADLSHHLQPQTHIEHASFDFSGAYMGIQMGWARFDGGTNVDNLASVQVDLDGGSAGVYAGFAYQLENNVVLGVEADVAGSWAEGFNQGVGPGGIALPPESGQRFNVDWTGAVRAKIGYAIGRLQPYIAGGIAFAGVRTTNIAVGVTGSTSDNTMAGWTLGAGAEYSFSDSISGRLEYRYNDYGSVNYVLDGLNAHQTIKSHEMRVGLSYKF